MGSDEDDVWLADLAAAIPFVQALADRIEVTEAARTTGGGAHDAYERTSLFDLAVWRGVGMIRGVKAALPKFRHDPALPNVEVPLSGGNRQEIDVPLRIGDVLVAVQTFARDVDKRIEEGDHAALEARWNSVRKKRAATDRNYAERLIGDPEARRVLRGKGLHFVLPVLCSPFAEPVASSEGRYWLRPPSAFRRGAEASGVAEGPDPSRTRGLPEDHRRKGA